MMTIKAPIELKVRTDFMKGYDSFGERIAGNYALMGLEIGEEELLHMVSAPPEIYLADAGSTTIGGNTFISSRNEEKYNIVNNMLNRILLSVDGELTYQDRTYITDALYKLGIKDDRKFMNEVRTMIEESHLEEDFLNTYFEMAIEGGTRELRQKTIELTKKLAEKDTYHTETTREDFLSESILHRLQTGAIYQIVSNFNRSLSDTRIELQESMLSEQENVAKKLLVQNFLSTVVREEPELVYLTEGRVSGEAGGEQTVREVSAEGTAGPGERVREDRSEFFRSTERELRETGELRTERETELRTGRDTAEIVYRQEGEQGESESLTPGVLQEREIVERTRVIGPGETEVLRERELRTEEKTVGPSIEAGVETGVAQERGRTVYEERPGETLTERVTEESSRITERSDREEVRERTGQYVTERGEVLRTEMEQSELIYREGETRETSKESLMERLTERLTEAGERITERQDTELRSTERIGSVPGQDLRTEREVSERILQEERDRFIPGEQLPGSITERVTEAGAEIRERTERELLTERTELRHTETGEILRTEHEGADIVYREERAAAEAEEGVAGTAGTLRETVVTERERVLGQGEPAVVGQPMPGGPGEPGAEGEGRVTERVETEYRTTESRTTEAGERILSEKEREELLREAGKESRISEEVLRESLKEQSTYGQERITERTEAESITERTDRYVTEQGEILRTEHEGAEIVYRDGMPAAGPEEGTAAEAGTVRETVVTERERYREPGETTPGGQPVSGAPGERGAEGESRVSERMETEYRTTERRTTEPGAKVLTETLLTELLREAGTESRITGGILRERLRELSTSELEQILERTETEPGTEFTERYVTEQGEILRTEHEGAELVYREGAEAPEPGEPGVSTQETLRETAATERERISERDRLEKERSTYRTAEQLREVVRTELRERLEANRTRTERILAGEGRETRAGQEQAEMILRETGAGTGEESGETLTREILRETEATEREHLSERERLERERIRRETKEEVSSTVSRELRDRLRTEQLRTERTQVGETPAAGTGYTGAERIFREERAAEGEEGTAAAAGRTIRETERYRSDNVYERELLEKESTRTEVTAGLTAAVLLDVVKTLFHAGSEKIGKGDTWIEYRGALYHSAENVFNRLNYNLEEGYETQQSTYVYASETVDIEHVDLSELQEITENVSEVEQIEKTIREMNEMNLQNVERYQQMVQVLKEIRPEKRQTGGMERTRQEALSLMDNEQALYESLAASEGEQEDQRKAVFHEITRLFPDRSVEIFKVVEQYLEGNGVPRRVGVTRNNVEEAAEEIRRITMATPVVAEPVVETMQTESSELVFRRNDRVTQEELQEVVESLRRSQDMQRREIEQREQQIETDRRNTYSVTSTTARTLSRQEAEDIEAMVSRGVRSQMGAISEQVLQKLEKKLKNEKIRRGI